MIEKKKKRSYPKRYVDEKGVLRDYMGYKVKPKQKVLNWPVAAKICEQVALGHSLTSVLDNNGHKKGWPRSVTTWYSWCKSFPELKELYNQAQEDRTDTYVDHILRVVKAVESGVTNVDVGKFVADQLKWIAAKHKPRTYGEKSAKADDLQDGPLKVEFNIVMPKEKPIKSVEAVEIDQKALPILEGEESNDE